MWITVVVVDHAWWPLGRRPSWTRGHTHTGQPRLDAAFEDDDQKKGGGEAGKRGRKRGKRGKRGDRSEVREV